MNKCKCEEPIYDLTGNCIEFCKSCGGLLSFEKQDIWMILSSLKALQNCCEKNSENFRKIEENIKRMENFIK